MEQKNLPNVTLALVLSILGFLCCCFGGVPGLLFGGIAFYLTGKDKKTYMENPELYKNYNTLKTVRIVAIIAMVLGVLYLLYTYWSISQLGGWDAYMDKVNEMMEQFQQQ